ncbi:solute carrier organic anion transporter family member 4A1 isoform X6 [Cephus cinctus]|uniref:Solute carrier organic anion transporter family member 4A1 isoform X6 n=1 Tax=Cephus cinctus TaxID=211228 RepID=A0AAJ7RQN5_CEPCN|nr:solute carrier organic anion transporter family member 4A1 isoform X6 [Cephus cinctus]
MALNSKKQFAMATGIDNPAYDASANRLSDVPDMNETMTGLPDQFGDGPRKMDFKPEVVKDVTDQSANNQQCGWLWFRPICLQKFRTAKWALFWLCWAGAVQGMVVNGFINVVITTIERRFGLRSSETGLIAGGYDIASFLLLVPVSYLGGRSNASKPRYIGVGILVLGLGSLLFALPHYLGGPYRGGDQSENVCKRMTNNTSNTEICDGSPDQVELEPYSGVYLVIFLMAQLLHGAGAAPFFTLGVTYLDENVSKKMSSVYLGSEELAKERVSEAHEKSTQSSGNGTSEAFSKIRELPRALTKLLGNPAFFMLNLAGASEGLLIAGFAAFLPKLIENQFSVSASSAALLMGLVTVPAGGGGTFLGGYLVKRWNLPCSGILKFCLFSTAACIIFTLCFALNCPNLGFAGLTVPYHNSISKGLSLNDTCNSGCGCSIFEFNPICGVDNVTYYSPCHAGCNKEVSINNVKVYSDCSCIDQPAINLTTSSSSQVVAYKAMNTTCTSSCNYLWLFVVLSFCNMFMTFICTMPALSATLRVVRDDQRSFALGIQWIKVRILGTIPAPMVFGILIDETCILWHETCDGRGACLVYDNFYMSRYMLALAFIGKAASLLFFFLAWWCYVPPGGRRVNPDPRQEPVATLILNDVPGIPIPRAAHT